ncbi:MAG: DUF4430 domain-containing protein [Ruminococcaceae bacterium]|nr:DUF4430 domain-containing protein [Oscillospiraceae bacterium]MBQ2780871.1 DUF4430 domain-containing protein [Clostridia bacterium]
MNKKRILSIVAAVCVLAVLVVGAVLLYNNFVKTADGDKTITFDVVTADGTETFTINTDALYLADALLEEGVITEKAADGMYTTINGVEALWENDEAWWNITKDGVSCTVGMNEQPIADGDHFEATYTNGFSY